MEHSSRRRSKPHAYRHALQRTGGAGAADTGFTGRHGGLPAGAGTVAFPAGGRTMPSRRQVITGVVGVAAGSAVAGCTSAAGANPAAHWADPGPSGGSSAAAAAPSVTFAPAADSTGVVPGQPVLVSTDGGTLQSVTVVAGHHTVAG